MAKKITIIGCGPGHPDYVTQQAQHAVMDSRLLVGSDRLLSLFDTTAPTVSCPAYSADAIKVVEQHLVEGPVTVLVSGDVGLCSLAIPLVAHFGIDKCRLIPGISSVQVAFSRLGLDWKDAKILSTHADLPKDALDDLNRFDRIAVLGGGSKSLDWVQNLSVHLGPQYAVYLCEDLTLETEHIRQLQPQSIDVAKPRSLSIYLFIKETR